jgi:hypothetical protein
MIYLNKCWTGINQQSPTHLSFLKHLQRSFQENNFTMSQPKSQEFHMFVVIIIFLNCESQTQMMSRGRVVSISSFECKLGLNVCLGWSVIKCVCILWVELKSKMNVSSWHSFSIGPTICEKEKTIFLKK